MKKTISLTMIMILVNCISAGQDKQLLSLDDVIRIASRQSLDAFRNKNMYLANYWEFRYFKADRLPSLTLDATAFDYDRSMQKVYNYDENRDEYIAREDFNSNLALILNQNVGFTGGRLFAQSAFNVTQKLGDDKLSSFSSTPFVVGYSQNINGYNRLKWMSKIEPIKFEKAKKEFLQSKEIMARKANMLFFDLVDAQIEVSIAETNLSNADTLYTIGQGRFQVGTVTQDELLNLELRFIDSKLALTRANIELERSKAALNSFLGYDKNTHIECIVPGYSNTLQISPDLAIREALKNNPTMLNHQQQLLEEDQKVQLAKSNSGVSGDLFALYGLNQTSEEIGEVYKDPLSRQQLEIGVRLPILDWGRRKGQLAMAKSNREVLRISINQERIDFEQDILLNVLEFNLQADQILSRAKADTIAQMQYEVTQQRFLIGKLDVTTLNLARTDREVARRAYIMSLRSYWDYYFNLRRLTLYDFERNLTLSEDFERLVNN